ncbi:hypothetical protein J2J97_32160 (plasmid) [Rhizobium bangladeshense]|uniref:hypothetical protein n=1 Tax=Rhizobium bangladeshense TaxID=1138189 RepID=UPI001A980895|nr:hypothetical protein [Rhizobium bangladeshense]QSY98560.1 hypothetical protein J2J97_32160 [Rhizobium bangladeshense]
MAGISYPKPWTSPDMKSSYLAALLIAPLSACVAAPSADAKPKQASIPADYKAQIKERLKTTLVDPYSLRDLEITAPQPIPYFGSSYPGVCLRFNPKNNYGAYSGMQTYIVYFAGGRMKVIDHPNVKVCGAWKPAPELAG